MENICDHKNCKKIGKHKAPIERDNSKKFKWLCLDHIKEFNRSWNYFKGMSDQEVCDFLKSDMTWHKPTQSFSSADNFFNILWKNTINEKETALWQAEVVRIESYLRGNVIPESVYDTVIELTKKQ